MPMADKPVSPPPPPPDKVKPLSDKVFITEKRSDLASQGDVKRFERRSA
jgi:hypothetical protein